MLQVGSLFSQRAQLEDEDANKNDQFRRLKKSERHSKTWYTLVITSIYIEEDENDKDLE